MKLPDQGGHYYLYNLGVRKSSQDTGRNCHKNSGKVRLYEIKNSSHPHAIRKMNKTQIGRKKFAKQASDGAEGA